MLKQIKTSTGLIIVFALAVILFGGVYTYYNVYLPDIATYSSANNLIVPTTKSTTTTEATTSGSTATSGSTVTTDDRLTYTSSTYGFSFKYPKTWTVTSDASEPTFLMIKSAETQARYEELIASGAATEGPAIDITVAYYANLAAADQNQPKKYTTFSELINDANYFSSPKAITFAGKSAYEATELGMLSLYTIVLEDSGHIYKIATNKENKTDLNANQQAILASFTIQ